MEFLHPALALGALTRLEIATSYIPLAIADDDMHLLPSSYPYLEVLHILDDADAPGPQQPMMRTYARSLPALSALLDLAHRIPVLRDLTMPFVLDQVQLDTLAGNPRLASRAMRRLDTSFGILEVPGDLRLEHFTTCIIAAFPDLATLCFPELMLHENKWTSVNKRTAVFGKG